MNKGTPAADPLNANFSHVRNIVSDLSPEVMDIGIELRDGVSLELRLRLRKEREQSCGGRTRRHGVLRHWIERVQPRGGARDMSLGQSSFL